LPDSVYKKEQEGGFVIFCKHTVDYFPKKGRETMPGRALVFFSNLSEFKRHTVLQQLAIAATRST
jgi:hypothetical protein